MKVVDYIEEEIERAWKKLKTETDNNIITTTN